ncbi:hypothetical protein N184_27060 [Sinorhizobium sp. GL28]|nr:hypothetical protein N184_27060 [Sinorhizobium sp. GL28]
MIPALRSGEGAHHQLRLADAHLFDEGGRLRLQRIRRHAARSVGNAGANLV